MANHWPTMFCLVSLFEKQEVRKPVTFWLKCQLRCERLVKHNKSKVEDGTSWCNIVPVPFADTVCDSRKKQ